MALINHPGVGEERQEVAVEPPEDGCGKRSRRHLQDYFLIFAIYFALQVNWSKFLQFATATFNLTSR